MSEAPAGYDHQASRWQRDEPLSLTDFVVRPLVLDLVRACAPARVVDLGCGEGYLTRQLASIASTVVGVDSSDGMLRLAREREAAEPLGIDYHHAEATSLPFLADGSQDVAVGVFITNYQQQLEPFYRELARVLRAQGRFVLCMPHPALFFGSALFAADCFPAPDFDYRASRGRLFHGTMTNLRGDVLEASVYHHTFEDHLRAIRAARLAADEIHEPAVHEALAGNALFEPVVGRVLYAVLGGFRRGD